MLPNRKTQLLLSIIVKGTFLIENNRSVTLFQEPLAFNFLTRQKNANIAEVWNTLWGLEIPALHTNVTLKRPSRVNVALSRQYFKQINSDITEEVSDNRERARSGMKRGGVINDMSKGGCKNGIKDTLNLREEFLSTVDNIFKKIISPLKLISTVDKLLEKKCGHDKLNSALALFHSNLSWRLKSNKTEKPIIEKAEIDIDNLGIINEIDPEKLKTPRINFQITDIESGNAVLDPVITFLHLVYPNVLIALGLGEQTCSREKYTYIQACNTKSGTTQMSPKEKELFYPITYISQNCVFNISASRGKPHDEGDK